VKILVTGSGGFIGSHLCEALIEQGHEVEGWDRKTIEEGAYQLATINRTIDVRDLHEDFSHEFPEFDIVFHLAAFTSVPESMKHPQEYITNNILGTMNVLDIVKWKRFVFVSSCAAQDCASVYAITKRAGELLVSLYDNTISLRYYNIIGERQTNESNAIPAFTNAMLSGAEPNLYSSGEQERDYVYVKDCVDKTIDLGCGIIEGIHSIGYGKAVKSERLLKDIAKILN